MYSNNSNGDCGAQARGFMALVAIMLAMGLGLMARPAAAAPFAYVTNNDATVSVIDTASNMVVATVVAPPPLPDLFGVGVAVTPDGKHVYVVGQFVFVIDTATNMVVANVNPGGFAHGVAVTPDGKSAYVTVPSAPADVVLIATATNTVVAAILLPNMGLIGGNGIAVTPDGKHAYVPDASFNTVLVIDTTTNTLVGTPIPVGSFPEGVAVTPDGKYVYVTNSGDWVVDRPTHMG